MADINRMAEGAASTVQDAANRVGDKAREAADKMGERARGAADALADKAREAADLGSETIRKAADKVNQTAKEGFKTAQQFSDAAQQYFQDSGLAELDLREFVKREPWIALGVAFSVGYVAARILRKVS